MKKSLLVLSTLFAALAANASDYSVQMQDYLNANVRAWQNASVLVEAIRAQNVRHSAISQVEIDNLDTEWRSQVGKANAPLISKVIENPASDFLRKIVAESGGQITEIFVMDSHGLNVASSGVTSDYWQGDEAKFSDTFGKGPAARHFGEVELDESTQTYQGQASLVIVDPDTGLPIGALTIGLNAESL